MELIFKTYESVIEEATVQEYFTPDNINDLYQLKAMLVRKSSEELKAPVNEDDTKQHLKVQKKQLKSVLDLLGGYEGIAQIIAGNAIMKQEIKILKARIPN